MISEIDLVDLMGNIDVGMLVDKIIEKDMKGSRRLLKTKKGKIILFLFPLILLVFIVILVNLITRKNE